MVVTTVPLAAVAALVVLCKQVLVVLAARVVVT
jgi:hypothetical protein